MTQREARSVITAINFLTDVILQKNSHIISDVKQKKVVEVGITAEELSELFNFGYHLGELADEQAELEASNEQPRLTDAVARLNGSYGQGQAESSIQP